MTDEQRWNQLVALHGRVEQELAKAIHKRHDLSLSEYRALACLAESPKGELRIQELAVEIGLNQSSVSRLVARMEAAGLACRDLCTDDRRGVYSVITSQGRARLAEACSTYREVLASSLDEASGDPDLGSVAAAIRD